MGKSPMDPADTAGNTNYRQLADRLGFSLLQRRITKQAGLWAKEVHQGKGIFTVERVVPLDQMIKLFLRITGLTDRGLRNFLDIQIITNVVRIEGLPSSFRGYRLLQLADLHLDLYPPLLDVILEKLAGVECDVVVLTGDYHNKIAENAETSLTLMGKLLQALKAPAYGILGNHDFIEKAAYLEAMGLHLLLNESVPLSRGAERIWLCGVDDPHYFKTEDLEKARAEVPKEETAILLSHSPETYALAEELSYALLLAGHTHGGQFCLPGGIPIVRNADVPSALIAGPWKWGRLRGYTSRGTGGCGVAARFNCPPEITLHILEG
jgi:uncharacterized protein